MRTPEGYEKHDVRRFLKQVGAYQISPTTFGMGKSTNDIVACIAGDFWLIEVKREGGKPTKRQETTAKEVIAAGGQVAWGTAQMIISTVRQSYLQRGIILGTVTT